MAGVVTFRWRSRFLAGVLVGVFATVGVFAGLLLVARSLALSDGCAALPREDLSVDEMAAIRSRVDAYDTDPQQPLRLTGRETSFLVREVLGVPAWIAARGSAVTAEVRVPSGERCYDVSFEGTIDVSDGVAHVVPSSLVVGRLDVTSLVAGRRIALEPRQVHPAPARDLLGHVVSLWVADGSVNLHVDDPGALR